MQIKTMFTLPLLFAAFASAQAEETSTIRSNLSSDSLILHDWWLRESASVWRMLATGILIVALAVAGFVIAGRISRNQKKPTAATTLLSSALRPILAIAALVGTFAFITPVLRSIPDLHSCNFKLFLTLVTLCAAWGAVEIVSLLSRGMSEYAVKSGDNLDSLAIEITRKLLKIVIVFAAMFFIGQSVFDLNFLPLLTGAGVAGLAVAFASKEALANFLGTLVIIADRPFRVGDLVRVEQVRGIVESVGMRSTLVRTENETLVMIPNSRIESSDVENFSKRGLMQLAFTVGLVYDSSSDDVKKAIVLLHSILDDFHGKDQEQYKPRVFIDDLGDSALNISCIIWLKTATLRQEQGFRSEIYLAVLDRFREAGLDMAYNTVTNYLAGDPAHPLLMIQQQPAAKQ